MRPRISLLSQREEQCDLPHSERRAAWLAFRWTSRLAPLHHGRVLGIWYSKSVSGNWCKLHSECLSGNCCGGCCVSLPTWRRCRISSDQFTWRFLRGILRVEETGSGRYLVTPAAATGEIYCGDITISANQEEEPNNIKKWSSDLWHYLPWLKPALRHIQASLQLYQSATFWRPSSVHRLQWLHSTGQKHDCKKATYCNWSC